MAQTQVQINNASAVLTTFVLQDQGKGFAKYIDPTTSLAAPRGISIEHTVKPAGQPGTDRHIVKVFSTLIDANGLAATAVVSVQFSVPRHPLVTDAVVSDLWAFAKNYVSIAGNVEKIIDGITY